MTITGWCIWYNFQSNESVRANCCLWEVLDTPRKEKSSKMGVSELFSNRNHQHRDLQCNPCACHTFLLVLRPPLRRHFQLLHRPLWPTGRGRHHSHYNRYGLLPCSLHKNNTRSMFQMSSSWLPSQSPTATFFPLIMNIKLLCELSDMNIWRKTDSNNGFSFSL